MAVSDLFSSPSGGGGAKSISAPPGPKGIWTQFCFVDPASDYDPICDYDSKTEIAPLPAMYLIYIWACPI